ncbi:MAG: PhoH family protein, partial [Gammaproteobacteria bacterium]|nr:PhoH family protein [Gammaproteobacteria bacterium]
MCGEFDRHLRQIERGLGVRISSRGNRFRVRGSREAISAGALALTELYRMAAEESLDAARIQACLAECAEGASGDPAANGSGADGDSSGGPDGGEDVQPVIVTPRIRVRPRGANQRRYVKEIRSRALTFGTGPPGPGKTGWAWPSRPERPA